MYFKNKQTNNLKLSSDRYLQKKSVSPFKETQTQTQANEPIDTLKPKQTETTNTMEVVFLCVWGPNYLRQRWQ